ncbi:MAG: ferrous iron transport protein B [Lachnospiraceae bacterium]|jgi:ferrous iron transport protein B|nr:ferrous iron transport protein B [Lachnospiraceae bacterium]
MKYTIALAGNPNTGKTTLFNSLTGSNQYVGNWPGVTVEKKEGKLKGHKDITIADLPGIYSLSPYTLEEVVARNYLLNEKPNAIINIIDGTNLERNLYLTTQILELGIPVVIAVNMADVIAKSGDILDFDNLSKTLGCPVVEISALKSTGIDNLVAKAVAAAQSGATLKSLHDFDPKIEDALKKIGDSLTQVSEATRRWYSIKIFERDEKILNQLSLPDSQMKTFEGIIAAVEKEQDDDAESIITTERYSYIAKIIDRCYKKRNKNKVTLSDKIDRIVTNRILALPIFAIIMFVVYYISISNIGKTISDWINDTLFGEIIQPGVSNFLTNIGCAKWLVGLVSDGIIAGVGSVIGFLPQMLLLFFFLAFLEGCGYMARIAFVMDRIFRKFGLSGKSFIPILVGTGCGVPGVMASRTIESEHDRRMTIMTTTFIPCSAKVPVIALIAGSLFNGAAWVGPSAYFVGMAAIIISGIMLKKTALFAGDPTPFVIELPPYHMPTAGSIYRSMLERSTSFIKKAGTIILLASILIWLLSNFSFAGGSFGMTDDMDSSILAAVGGVIAHIFKPLGFGDWKFASAAITGLIAKENVVNTFGILFHSSAEDLVDNSQPIWAALQAAITPLAAYSFLVFNLLCAPCFAAIGAIKREMSSGKWTLIAIGYECIFAYVISLIIYQLGIVFTGAAGFSIGTAVAIILIALIIFQLVRPAKPTAKSTAKNHRSVVE